MKHLTLFTLLIGLTTGSGLSCIKTDEPLEVSLDDFDEEAFSDQIDGLEDSVDVDDGYCRLQIKLDYHQELLTVSFTEDIQTGLVGVDQIRFETIVLAINATDATVINIFEYACDSDECEKHFLVDMVGWLLEFDTTELQTEVMPWFSGDTHESGE